MVAILSTIRYAVVITRRSLFINQSYSMSSYQKFLAEAAATGTIVFVAGGALLANAASGGSIGPVGIALAIGLASFAVIQTVAHISGAHANPALSIAAWTRGKLSTPGLIMYVLAQLIGAAIGAWFLSRIFPASLDSVHLGAPELSLFAGRKATILLEAVFASLLAWVYQSASDKRSSSTVHFSLAVGAVYAVASLVGSSVTGGAINPARAFGPAFIIGDWTNQWLFWIGPVLGAVIGSYTYRIVAGRESV